MARSAPTRTSSAPRSVASSSRPRTTAATSGRPVGVAVGPVQVGGQARDIDLGAGGRRQLTPTVPAGENTQTSGSPASSRRDQGVAAATRQRRRVDQERPQVLGRGGRHPAGARPTGRRHGSAGTERAVTAQREQAVPAQRRACGQPLTGRPRTAATRRPVPVPVRPSAGPAGRRRRAGRTAAAMSGPARPPPRPSAAPQSADSRSNRSATSRTESASGSAPASA